MEDVVPWNLKKRESTSGNVFAESPEWLIACIMWLSMSSTHSIERVRTRGRRKGQRVDLRTCAPMGELRTSVTAETAVATSGNWATATEVGSLGASRSVASVTIPRVPSAPMKSLVVSKPAEDLRARRRVLMTSPEGRTTVCSRVSGHPDPEKAIPYYVQEPFSFGSSVLHSVCYQSRS